MVRFNDIIAYINHPKTLEEAVRLIYQECAKKLGLNTADSDEEGSVVMSKMPDMSELMSSAMSGTVSSKSNSIIDQLRAKVEESGGLDDIAPPDLEVSLKPITKNDQYGTSDFQVMTDSVRVRLQEAKAACEKLGAHFPYGYGLNKDLLRISKCKINPGKTVNVTVRFYVWSRDGKRGITCYLKK